MRNLDLQTVPVGAQILLTLIIVFVSFVITMVLGAIIGNFVFENSFAEIMGMADFTDIRNLPLLKYLQIVQSIGLFVIPPFIAAALFGSSVSSYLKFKTTPFLAVIVMTIALTIAATPFINFLAQLNANMSFPAGLEGIENWMKQMEDTAAELTEMLLAASTFDVFLLNLFMIAVLPAIGEELLFRGVIQKQITRFFNNKHLGIWLAAILFSALHMQFYGFIPRMFLGVMFGYLLVWTGSIWIPIIAHFVNNAAAVIFYYLYSTEQIAGDFETIGAGETEKLYVVFSILIMLSLLFGIYRYQQLHSHH